MKRIYKILVSASIVAQIIAVFKRKRVPFMPDVPMLAACRICKQHVQLFAGNRLTVHLIHDHALPHEEAYQTVDWVLRKAQEHRRVHHSRLGQ